ncbi:N-alpha-acetyltransferase 30 isoform X1 [Apteryx rowi]|uniref:N-alpha-acetyltransferase 30 n=1 Tax=Apteryx owenii TaxID=8824 RepID=A0A8B9PTC9_APTOW|nr:PREDICTED: N-alpha-acetyltransferase 30 isoform X1 [Apteryx mantelli mantelli]XP_025911888.1 N-alpha-acetyltransferase 30 isoform X1 [Apteryx rowi]
MAEVPPGPSSVLSPQGDTLSPFPGGGGGGGAASSSSSSTSSAAAAACTGAQDEEAEEEEEEEGPAGGREQQQQRGGGDGGKGGQQQHRLHHHHHHPPHHNHQLNGVISPELRHLRASLKGKILSSEAGAAPEGLENKRASKTMGSGQQQQQSSPPAAAPCSTPLSNHLPPQGRTAPSPPPPPSPPAAAATGDRSQPAATTTTAAKSAARNGLAGGTGLEEEEQEEGDEGGEEEEEESLLLLSRSLAAACSLKGSGTDSQPEEDLTIRYVRYESELQMPDIMRLITKDLSEPYSIYTYRYFIHNWPQLCFLAMVGEECVGAIVCKLDMHKKMFRRGYIAMLAVDSKYRRKGIGTNLVKKAIYAMVEGDCDEVVLETEITNKSALKLYENLGFVRDKRLFRYYLNGVDALRLKLWLR